MRPTTHRPLVSMDDPYAPPRMGSASTPPGTLVVSEAIASGLDALTRNLPVVVAAALVGLTLYYLGCCTCVGWLAIVPALIFGGLRLMLATLDGQARLDHLFDGFRELSVAFLRIWSLLLLWLLASSPVIGISLAMTLPPIIEGASQLPLERLIPVLVMSSCWPLLMVRLMATPFLIVDRDLGTLEALGTSWKGTQGQGLQLAALYLILVMLSLPGAVLTNGANYVLDPRTLGEGPFLLTMLSLQLGGSVLSVMGSMVGLLILSAGYRQLFGGSARVVVDPTGSGPESAPEGVG